MAITTLENVKILLGISDTSQDDKINLYIPLVESDYLNIRNKPFDTDTNDDIVYPTGSELTSIKMIAFNLQRINSQGVRSESLGEYSVSFSDVGVYPEDIIKHIKKFAVARS